MNPITRAGSATSSPLPASTASSMPAPAGSCSPRGAGRARVPTPLAEGGEIRSGSLRLSALWPPRDLAAAAGSDPNAASLVLLARWRDFEMLLTGDAEAEAVPLDPGPIDVLKVSHHGSADAGLGRAARPRGARGGGDLSGRGEPVRPPPSHGL